MALDTLSALGRILGSAAGRRIDAVATAAAPAPAHIGLLRPAMPRTLGEPASRAVGVPGIRPAAACARPSTGASWKRRPRIHRYVFRPRVQMPPITTGVLCRVQMWPRVNDKTARRTEELGELAFAGRSARGATGGPDTAYPATAPRIRPLSKEGQIRRRKSLTAALNAAGASRFDMWPASGIRISVEPAIAWCIDSDSDGGVSVSSSPTRISVGMRRDGRSEPEWRAPSSLEWPRRLRPQAAIRSCGAAPLAHRDALAPTFVQAVPGPTRRQPPSRHRAPRDRAFDACPRFLQGCPTTPSVGEDQPGNPVSGLRNTENATSPAHR